MFKHLSLYRITGDARPAAERLQVLAFVPCGKSQPQSVGFVPPRDEHGALMEVVHGQLIFGVMFESRSVPGDALNKEVDRLAAEVEQQTGRKPGRKFRKELKEQALATLLPNAFSKFARVPVWIEPSTGLLAIGSTTSAKTDAIVTLLVHMLSEQSKVAHVTTATSPAGAMTAWLNQGEAVGELMVGRHAELQSLDELKSKVTHKNRVLDSDEVKEEIAKGLVAKKLALVDGATSYTLTDALQLRSLDFGDAVPPENSEDAFDATVVLATSELNRVINNLISALGGEVKAEQ